jgi:hypothetical protein
MTEKSKFIDALRVRVIAFRDYYDNDTNAMTQSNFFSLPRDNDSFRTFVNAIKADGGGDEPENGLEALALAIRSPWSKDGDRKRQVIAVWTDASVHPLEKHSGSKPGSYPQDLPTNFYKLTDMWEAQDYMSRPAKRLVIFAPDSYAWTNIATNWEQVVHYPSTAGAGLADQDYQEILDALANSV